MCWTTGTRIVCWENWSYGRNNCMHVKCYLHSLGYQEEIWWVGQLIPSKNQRGREFLIIRKHIVSFQPSCRISVPCLFNCVHDCQLPSNKITHNQQLRNQISYEFQKSHSTKTYFKFKIITLWVVPNSNRLDIEINPLLPHEIADKYLTTMVEDWGAYQRLGNGRCT